MSSCNPVAIPFGTPIHLLTLDPSSADTNKKTYHVLIGKLVYAMVGSGPDLAFAIAVLAKFTAAPTNQHMGVCKRVLRYLRGTSSYGLLYSITHSVLAIQTDSNCGGDKNNRNSISGYVFTFAGAASSASKP